MHVCYTLHSISNEQVETRTKGVKNQNKTKRKVKRKNNNSDSHALTEAAVHTHICHYLPKSI